MIVGVPKTEIISKRAKGSGRLVTALFSAVFLAAGLLFLWFVFLRPWLRSREAREWTPVPCVVESSEVKTHSDSDGATYSVRVVYRYRVNGFEHKGARYDFVEGSSSGYEGKRRIVAQYPPGMQTTCFVNPQNPEDAVLEREIKRDRWFVLIPLVFVGFGAAGVVYSVLPARSQSALSSAASRVKPQSALASTASLVTGPVELKQSSTPLLRFFGLLFVAAFWNGIVSIFVVQAVKSFQRGSPEWGLTIFISIFVLIGIGIICAAIVQLLAVFNPRPHLTANATAVPLGGTLEVAWHWTGLVARLRRLHLYLEGREEATYRRGTSTSTDKSVFARLDLTDTSQPMEIRDGTAAFTLPVGSMHTFQSANNKIVWVLHAHGEIARWPNVKEEFPITVLPAVVANQP